MHFPQRNFLQFPSDSPKVFKVIPDLREFDSAVLALESRMFLANEVSVRFVVDDDVIVSQYTTIEVSQGKLLDIVFWVNLSSHTTGRCIQVPMTYYSHLQIQTAKQKRQYPPCGYRRETKWRTPKR
jgi:hypothetical protein